MDTTDKPIFRYGLVMYKKEGLRHQGQYSIIGIFILYNIKKHHSFCVSDTRTTKPHQTGTLLLLGCTTDAKNHLGGYAKLIRNIYSNRGTESPTNACCKRWSCRSFNHPDTCVSVSNSTAVKAEMPLRISNTGNRLWLVVAIGLAIHIRVW